MIQSRAATADAAATALFVAGPKQWRQIANDMGVSMVMLISTDKKIHLSEAMKKRVKFEPKLQYQIVVDKP